MPSYILKCTAYAGPGADIPFMLVFSGETARDDVWAEEVTALSETLLEDPPS